MSWSSMNRFNDGDPYMIRDVTTGKDVESWYSLAMAIRAVNVLNQHAVSPKYENKPPHYIVIEVRTGEQVHNDGIHRVVNGDGS